MTNAAVLLDRSARAERDHAYRQALKAPLIGIRERIASMGVDQADIGHIARTVQAVPSRFAPRVLSVIERELKKHGRQASNLKAGELFDTFKVSDVSLAASDADIILRAEQCAKRVREMVADVLSGSMGALGDMLRRYAESLLGMVPAAFYRSADWLAPRLCDARYWRRLLRTTIGRRVERVARELGAVHRKAGVYVSDETLGRRRAQVKRNAAMLARTLAESEQGQLFTLQELSGMGISNPANRYAELMMRARGMEESAKRDGLQCAFIVLTCPSRMHSHSLDKADGKWRVFDNPKFDGTTPREAQDYLCKVWASVRSEWQRKGVKVYGLRTAEPHHDSTPHWNLLLFTHLPAQVIDTVRRHGLKDSPDEPGAERRRVEAKILDPNESPAGYIAKYISKTVELDEAMVETHSESDLPGRDATERAVAWARTWGIRQFQQIGGPSVSTWREIRRCKAAEQHVAQGDVFAKAKVAAELQDWSRFADASGGQTAKRKDRPIKPLYAETLNQYGELAKRMAGVCVRQLMTIGIATCIRWEQVKTRCTSWTIRRGRFNDLLHPGASAAARVVGKDDFVLKARSAVPRTRVNNCTEHLTRAQHAGPPEQGLRWPAKGAPDFQKEEKHE